MANLFKVYDYNKEGPGVQKNERKKKGFFAFFEIYLRNFWNFAKMGPIYWLTSILVVTNGLAKVGFTHIARSAVREKHAFLLSDYLDTIKKNWKQALSLGVINLVASAIAIIDVWYFWGSISQGESMSAISVIGLAVAFFLIVSITYIKYYIWTLTITFDLSIKTLIKNSFHFVFLNMARNILISVIMGAIYAGLYILAMVNAFCFIIAVAILVFVVPGFKLSLIQANTFPAIKKYMIDPYYKEHKGEDIEKRRALGLEIADDELEIKNQETIFSDKAPKPED